MPGLHIALQNMPVLHRLLANSVHVPFLLALVMHMASCFLTPTCLRSRRVPCMPTCACKLGGFYSVKYAEGCHQQVYDLRLTARVMSTIPFSSGPSMLRFHPRYQDTLLIGASSGQFIMDHVQAAGYSQLMQVWTISINQSKPPKNS